MKVTLSLLLYIFFLNLAHATDIAAPQSIFGEYENKHQISFICFDQKNGECFCPDGNKQDEHGYCYVTTVDKLLIKNIKNKSEYNVHLTIQAIGTNLHTCDFDGDGDWEKYNDRLLVRGEENEDGNRCEVILFFKKNKAHVVTRPLGFVCNDYCGVSTGLDGLVFQKKLSTGPFKR